MRTEKYYIWSTVDRLGTQALSFIGSVIIARVLQPSDYGLIAMLAIIMGLAWNFTESGFADSLIRKRDADKLDFGTVATFNIVVALIMYLTIYLISPYISDFFQKKELTDIARILGLSIVIRALNLTAIVELRKRLKFKKLAIMNIITSITSISLTYLMANKGFGYWSLAFQPIFISLSNFVFLIINGWKPFFFFDFQRFKNIFGFSANIMISYITNQFGSNLYSAIIGRFYTVNQLGFYRQAQKMQEVPTLGLNSIILTTSYSLIANENDREVQRKMYLNLFDRFLTIQSILVFLLIGLAEPIWIIFLGVKWESSIPFFQLFVIISLTYPIVTINSNIAKINNKSKIFRNLTLLRNGLQVVALLVFAKTNLTTLLYGQIAASFISVLVDMHFCGRLINFGITKQFKVFLSIIYAPFISFLIATFVCNLFDISLVLRGFLWFAIFFIAINLIYIITNNQIYKITIQNINNKLKKYNL